MKHETLEQMANHLQSQLHDEHDGAVRNNQLIANYSHKLKEIIDRQINQNAQKIENISFETNELYEKAAVFTDLLSILGKVMYRQAINMNFLKLMQQCRANLVPSVLLETGALKADLRKLQGELLSRDMQLAIPIDDIHTYMQVDSSTCYFSDQAVVIRINVPYVTKGYTYKLYTLEKIPYVFDKKICTVDIDDELIVEKNGKEIIPLSRRMTHECKSSSLCYVPRYRIELSHSQLCLETSLLSQTTIPEIRKACPVKCSTHNLNKPIVLYLNYKEYGIIYPNKSITIRCAGRKDDTISTANQVGLLTIKLSCKCSIFVGDQVIKNEYPCIKDDDPMTAWTVTHEISAAWAFGADTLFINKHTTMHNASKIVDDSWMKEVPVFDPFIVKETPFKPSFHQKNSHFFSYTSMFMVIIVIIIVILAIFKGKKLISLVTSMADPTAIVQKIFALLSTQPPVAEGKSTLYDDETHDVILVLVEIMKIFLLTSILATLLFLTYKLLKSKFLKIFSDEFGDEYDSGRIKISMLSTDNTALPIKSIQQRFRTSGRSNTYRNSRSLQETLL